MLRTRVLVPIFCGLVLFSAVLAAQDWRGKARVDGWVKDTDGQPIEGAKVQLTREAGGSTAVKTNKKGYWSVMGLIGGPWNVDITAGGYELRQLAINLSEAARVPPLDIKMTKSAPAAPDAGVSGGAPPETVEWIKEGNRLLEDVQIIERAQRGDPVAQAALSKRGYTGIPSKDAAKENYAQARALYEKALAAVPGNPAILKGIAQAYAGEGNREKSVETLRQVLEADPDDNDSRVLVASMLLETGKLEEGKAMLDALPEGAVKDSGVYANVGILFMNKGKAADAATYLTRGIALDPADADLYYYRGLAYMQAKKNAEAKADLNKYLELKPEGPEAKEVREILQALK